MNYIKNTKKLCHKCLQKKEGIVKYEISKRGYGSKFDDDKITIQLCPDCDNLSLYKWVNEKPQIDGYEETYKYEDDILNFINSLPIQGREIIYNQTNKKFFIDSQEWIDRELEDDKELVSESELDMFIKLCEGNIEMNHLSSSFTLY
ncbi:hypothetical protein GCM10008904_32460 [Paraclostridium ghonii]|uniref:DUF1062 domain-containing protein n=1 Tax=Paraclostridium ghonii TaxID=29358 RepID=A0ABU0MXK9_9FIRM|nr:hypothetical protein [Paeniclostridium ghonii]MDQ0555349.1 hypothetical protein [Paeniclostridium ghonii]